MGGSAQTGSPPAMQAPANTPAAWYGPQLPPRAYPPVDHTNDTMFGSPPLPYVGTAVGIALSAGRAAAAPSSGQGGAAGKGSSMIRRAQIPSNLLCWVRSRERLRFRLRLGPACQGMAGSSVGKSGGVYKTYSEDIMGTGMAVINLDARASEDTCARNACAGVPDGSTASEDAPTAIPRYSRSSARAFTIKG